MDVFVSNSYWEGQQVALLEAMATGCHCLAHAWSGVEEVLPADNVYVTDNELQGKILDYCGVPDSERRARQERMRTIACEKFDLEMTRAGVRRVIERACDEGPRASA